MPEYTFPIDLGVDGATSLQISTGLSLAVSMGASVVMPYPWAAQCSLMEPGQDLTPPTGGQGQRIARLGSRWSVTFASMPSLGVDTARLLLSLRAKARANAETIVFQWPQPDFTLAVGSPVVNGAGQLGTSLIVGGLAAGVTIPAMTFFSVAGGGRVNLLCTTAPATASGGGAATLGIAPMWRASPDAGAPLAFASPSIEGFIQGRSEDWTLERLAWVGLPAFTVMEPT